jgi:hypothetical protein
MGARGLALVVVAVVAACAPEERSLPDGDPAALAGLQEVRDHACACRDAACTYRVLVELLRYADRDPDLRDSRRAVALTDELNACLTTAVGIAPVDAGVDAPPPGRTGLVACDEYIRMMEAYARCDQLPQQSRDAITQAMEEMKDGWANMGMANMPDDARKSANDACRQAADAVVQGAEAMGCQMPARRP